MKKLMGILLAAVCAVSFGACTAGGTSESSSQSVKEKPEHLGLYVADDGTLMKDGKAFYGIGVNYYNMLNRAFSSKWDVSASLSALETLAEYDVRVIRFNIAGYSYGDWDYVIKKEDRYFEALDSLADKAEELGIGLIPSFFWNQMSLSDYFDEPAGLALRTRETKTMKFVASFVGKVVSRYAEHPAFYGWEYGNETDLSMDLPDGNWNPPVLPAHTTRPSRTKDDKIMSPDYVNALALFAETVRENDPYNRMIGTGNGHMRGRAYQLHKLGDWGPSADSDEQHEYMLDFINESVTAVSSHMYGDGDSSVDVTPEKLTSERGDFSDWDGFMEYFVGQSRRMKKAVYLGETNCGYNSATAVSRPAENSVAVAREIAKAAVKADLQLTMFWNYDDRPDFNPDVPNNNTAGGTEWSWNERWEKGKGILELVKEYNAAFDQKHAS